MDAIRNDILNASYWEHFKAAKDLALLHPIDHPKRAVLENEMKIIYNKLHDNL